MQLGAHMSIAGGLHLAFQRIQRVGGTVLQIFTRNQRRWHSPPLQRSDISSFRQAWSRWGHGSVAVHDSYLVNLGSRDAGVRKRSQEALAEELRRTRMLAIPWLVTHPGTHGGRGMKRGIDVYTRGLDLAISRSGTEGVTVLLETTAGQGASLGGSFENIGRIIDLSEHPSRLGVCLDTCHVFAAGYDLRTRSGLEKTLETFHRCIGLEKLHLLHLNDSMGGLGSRRDRHEHIGRGAIGLQGFEAVVTHPALSKIPGVLETPGGEDLLHDRDNLDLLHSLSDAATRNHQ